jgi:ribonuclease R
MSRNKKNNLGKPQRIKKNALFNLVIEAMQASPYKLYNYKQLASALGLSTIPERQLLMAVLDDLALQEMVVEVERGKYKLNTRGGYVEGIIDRQSSGKNYLLPDDGGEPIFIAERRLRQAMNKDRVKVFLFAHRPGTEPEGEVVEI